MPTFRFKHGSAQYHIPKKASRQKDGSITVTDVKRFIREKWQIQTDGMEVINVGTGNKFENELCIVPTNCWLIIEITPVSKRTPSPMSTPKEN